MEKFVVSARKYRPQNFSSVVGQEHITTTLKNAINNNQLAHAFLFCGPRGVGKTTCARILAKTINCENRTPEGEACNECQSCVSFDRGTSLNIHELDAASNNSVEDIRSLVEQVRFAPQAGKYKVYIVDEVHMLSNAAFNAFLKTLEEPPPFAIFILATTEKHKIIATILSRCQIFDFKRMTNADTAAHLKEISIKENIHTEDAALHVIAQKSEGCMRDSLSLFDKIVSFTSGEVTYKNTLVHLNILDEDYFFTLLEQMRNQKLSDVLLTFDEINRKGFEGDAFLNGFAEFLRNMLVSKDARVAGLLEVAEDFKPKYARAAADTSVSWLISALNIVNESEVNIRQAKNKRLHTELTLIKLCYLNQAIEFSSEGGVKKKLNEGVKSVSFRALVPRAVPEDMVPAQPVKGDHAKTPNKPAGASLVIEETRPGYPKKTSPKRTSLKRIKSLDTIQKTIAAAHHQQTTKALNDEELFLAWEGFISNLEKEGQVSAVSSFRDARLSIQQQDTIEIVSSNEYHQHFIESERSELIRHLQNWFNNRMLTFTVKVEAGEQSAEQEEYLNSREKYLRMIKEFPAVKELKEKLGMKLEM